MKNNLLKYFALLLILVYAVGCGKKDDKNAQVKTDGNAVNTAAYNNFEKVSIGNEKVILNYRFKKGDKFTYKLTTLTVSDQSLQADTLSKSKTNQSTTYIFDFKIIDVDKNNTADLEVNLSAMKIVADVDGQKIEYDSKANNDAQVKQRFIEYETIINSPFRAKVNNKGEIVEVSHLDMMVERINSVRPSDKKLSKQEKTTLASNIRDGAIKPITQLVFREMPDKEVAKDSSWTEHYPGNLGGIFQLDNTAKFRVEDFVKVNGARAAKVSADLSVKWTGNKQGNQNGVSYNFADPKIGGGGIILFNIDSGRLIKVETSTRVEMSVQIETKDEKSQKMKKSTKKDISSNRNIVEAI
jgi:Family of unknown function (DUF6263)